MISKKIKNLKASATLALAAKAKALKAEGHDVISLSVGEPDWDTSLEIKDAGIDAIKAGETKYSPAAGIPELRQVIATQTSKDFGVSYAANQVTVTAGGKFVIYSALQALLDPGDEVIIPAPYWVSYPSMVEISGGKAIIAETGDSAKLTPAVLEKHISAKTKMLVINSPSNPTGSMYSMQELKDLAAVVKKHPQFIVLSDDIYNRLVFNESGLAPHILQACPELASRVLNINGVSKTYSMTGWRLGWAVGPEEIIAAMGKLQSQTVSCAASFTQKAAIKAIESTDMKPIIKDLKSRRDFVVEEANKLDGIHVEPPDGAFYCWFNIKEVLGKKWNGQTVSGSKEFSQFLLEDQKLVVVPGAEFGQEGYVRVSYALVKEKMQIAFERMRKFLEQLR